MTMKVFDFHIVGMTSVMLNLCLFEQQTIRHYRQSQNRYNHHSNKHCYENHLAHTNIDFSYRKGNISFAREWIPICLQRAIETAVVQCSAQTPSKNGVMKGATYTQAIAPIK